MDNRKPQDQREQELSALQELKASPGYRLLLDSLTRSRGADLRKIIGEADPVKIYRLQGRLEAYDAIFPLVDAMMGLLMQAQK